MIIQISSQEHGLITANPEAASKPPLEMSTSSGAGKSEGKSVSKMATSVLKWSPVDVPLALTEGLHNLPELYGDKVRKHNKVTDWKSGTAEAGKVCVLRLDPPTQCFEKLRLLSKYFEE